MHDRPRSWACVRVSDSSLFRPRTLPSVSQFCTRLKSERMALVRRMLHKRDAIERHFAHLTNCGGGLSSLPAWGRTLPRVRLWIDAKIAIDHARRLAKETLAMM